MVIAIVPIILLIVGVLIWVLSANAILKDIGRALFMISLFWLVYALLGKTVHIG